MRVYLDHKNLTEDDRGASIAIGNFDGVHLGHQAVIQQARRAAETLSCPLGIVTFEPHPREYFKPDAAPFRLMNSEAKTHRLDKLGIERLYQLPFDKDLAKLSARDFAGEILGKSLGLRHVVVGADFRFGAGRDGTADDLIAYGEEFGFGVTIAQLLQNNTGAGPVSSTRIRTALAEGRPKDAMAMLGHWHRIEGPVIHGEKRGRTLGYPTANMSLNGLHLPCFGVYTVLVNVLDGPHAGHYGGVASLGVRPMFGENTANLETHLFDFSGDLYGADVSVALVEFLRPEMKFNGLEALISQMGADSARSRKILADLS